VIVVVALLGAALGGFAWWRFLMWLHDFPGVQDEP
jgi:hypothetical protein